MTENSKTASPVHPGRPAATLAKLNAVAELQRIIEYSRGSVGVSALHVETGERLGLHEDCRFPLESTIKIAIAMKVLALVDAGELALSDWIEVQSSEMNSGGPLGEEFLHDGVALSVMNLLEPMITRSCNTSTDVMFRVAGGAEAVADYVETVLGIEGFESRYTMRHALCVLHDIAELPFDVSERDALRNASFDVIDARNRMHGEKTDYRNDLRDQCTPYTMIELLNALWSGKGITRASRDLLLDIMSRTTTSPERVKGRLPQGVPFANKTGSGLGAAADVGFLTLPDGRGTVALAVYVKDSPENMAYRNSIIADVARLAYDYFVLIS
ncbi:beta-lactamase class A [Paraburkholderia fungorum]|uniref:beta-lactamase n=1 Tax=Paraburkholderia fungorum TaxID=134537 RepID=A0A1H1JV03_9BURK|nr:serine hydrolase [Paraburkholderia fungorum]SDR53901.1 beta-lactamase class A [Paraburkholderia fungorum]